MKASVRYVFVLVGALLNVMAVFILFSDIYLRVISYPLGLAGGVMLGLALASTEEAEQVSVIKAYGFSEVPSALLQTALARFPQISVALRGEKE